MNKITYNYQNLSPFKWYVLENFPFIEADFDAITEWQLFCKLGNEMNKIIDSVNLTGEQVETLTTAFNNLQNYVNNYFDNLDVQEEVNNKLNQMVTDGTLAQIINETIFNELNEKISQNTEDIKKLNSDMLLNNTKLLTDINNLDTKFSNHLTHINNSNLNNKYKVLLMPSGFKSSNTNIIDIYYNNNNFFSNFPIEKIKNNATNTWYIAPSGTDVNDGKSINTPKQSILSVLSDSDFINGDNIMLADGLYPFQNIKFFPNKSCNIIANKRAIVFGGVNSYWNISTDYSNIYYVDVTNISNVFDIKNVEHPIALKSTTSLEELSNTPNGYYNTGSRVYINPRNYNAPFNYIITRAYNLAIANIPVTNTSPITLYMENITFLGSEGGRICIII